MLHLRTLAAALVIAALPPALQAQGWIELERPIRPGFTPGTVERTSSVVRASLDGRVARIEVEEHFRNRGGGIAEGTYLYPLPGEAVFENFSLWMGEIEVRGEMLRAEEARRIYEEIVRRVRDPALLTLEGHGLVRARVFPINPGETRRVVLRYTQLLERNGDALRLRYAMGQRNAPAASDRLRFSLTLPDADRYGTPYSPTHNIATRRTGDALVVSVDSAGSGDLDLFFPLRRGLVGTTLLTHAPPGEDGYFLLLLSPAQRPDARTLPKDLTLVVDVSGSMSGNKIEQARAALIQALGSLRAEDRFRIIAFSSRVTHFRDGFAAATPETVTAARRFVSDLRADGGTDIAGALEAALGATVAEERLPIIVFMTDGLPSVGERAPDRIAERAGTLIGRSRIFTVGIGHDVNTYLLDRLAQEGRGTADYVAPEASVEQSVGALLSRMQHPALTGLRIAGAPVELTATFPSQLPDVFFGQELVVVGRYRGSARGNIVLTGDRAGRTERFVTGVEFPSSAADHAYIPRLWASRRIGELMRQIRIEGSTETLVREVRELGLRYGILTEYTSYLVQEPNVAATAPRPDMLGGAGTANRQTGGEAFRRAQSSASMMGASNLAAADAAAGARAEELAGASGRSMRRVSGRLFVLRDGVWTDAAHGDSLNVVEVAAFSEAYFQLVRALPEISRYLSVGDSVVIAGRRASIRITSRGTTSWRAGQLAATVRAFRGA